MEQRYQQRQEAMRQLSLTRELAMNVPTFRYELFHSLIRLVVVVNLSVLVYERSSTTFYQSLRRMNLDEFVLIWFLASSLGLPLCVGLEARWVSKGTSKVGASQQRGAILVDAVFSLVWFLAWWGAILYALTHRAVI